MKTNRLLPLIAFSVLLLAPVGAQNALAAPGDLYAGQGGFGPTPGAVKIVAIPSGIETLVGDDRDRLSGLAYDNSGRLFGSVPFGGGGPVTLVEIDPNTGLNIAGPFPINDGSEDRNVTDLTVHPVTDVLWGVTGINDPIGSGILLTIDKASGFATVVGVLLTADFNGGGLAFNTDGTVLYYSDVGTGVFYRVDPTTRMEIDSFQTIDAVNFSPPEVIIFDGLGVRNDGTVFGTRSSGIVGFGCIYPIDHIGQTIGPVVPTSECYSDLDFRPIPPQMAVGGTGMSIDTTALLLASAQTFSWMIPVILSGIGIGLFVVSRKSE